MSKSKKPNEPSSSPQRRRRQRRPLDERIAIHHEWNKTARWAIVAAAIVTGIYFIVDGVVRVAAINVDGPWLAALKLILAAATPSVLTVSWLWNKYKRFVVRNTAEIATRNAELESQRDPARSSSRLPSDGSDPLGPLQ